mgnify:CR=1 FL=1
MEELYLISFQDAEEIRNMEYKIRKQLREQGLVAKYRFENILGQSAAMKQLVTSAKKIQSVGCQHTDIRGKRNGKGDVCSKHT